jgi:hypothetical protein
MRPHYYWGSLPFGGRLWGHGQAYRIEKKNDQGGGEIEGIGLGPVAVPFREIKKPVKAAPLVPIAGHVVNPIARPR